jgi:uncharacterized repeat protein (TIGR01451 family)/fimbrial isopeptide formation D2 family protein
MLVGLASVLTAIPLPSRAANTAPFTAAFSTNANGAMIAIGNSLLTCPAGSSSGRVSCADAQAGGVADNNGFTMVDLDADNGYAGGAATWNSSSSDLNLPAGATVLWAGLYWGARLDRGTNGVAGTGNRQQIQFGVQRGGGAISYQTIGTDQEFGPNTTSSNAYQEMADVTSIVQANGNASYWGANVVAGTGQDRYAGWAMTVVYSAPGLPLRNLTVFDGFNVVGAGSPQTITVNGFKAPLSGTVDAQLSMVTYEGDLSQTGDYAKLNNTQLATAQSPGSNFFDSSNEDNGATVTTRNPAYQNQLGFDVMNLGASGAIANGATSATFTFSSNGDVYYPGMLGMAINLYAPDFTASSKTVVDLNGNSPARPGDTLEYTLNYVNTGQDPAVKVVSTDPLPDNTTYVPGSLRILAGANAGPLTDAGGDDQGEVGGRTVTVRLGAGADQSNGGSIAVGSATSYSFRVTLDDAAGGTTVTNLATLGYRTGTTDIGATYTTNPASVDVTTQADVSITKEMAPDPAAVGGAITGTITVTNNGPNAATGVTMRDPLIEGWTNDSIDAPAGVTCTVTSEILCQLGTLAPHASVVILAHGHLSSDSTRTSLTNVAYASTTSYDPDLTNNVASDTITLRRQADLAIAKTVTPTSAAPGNAVTYTLSVTNHGDSDAQGVVISDAVANAAQLTLTQVTGTTGGATCAAPQGSSLRCTVDTLAAGATATVTLTGVLAANLDAAVSVGNTATVTAETADPDAGNNTATVQVTTTAPNSDVVLTKSAPGSVVAGSSITYTVAATNNGPSDASGVQVTDPLPAGVTLTSATTSRGSCDLTATPLTCAVGALPDGASATITIVGQVAPDVAPGAGVLVNTATVTSNGPTHTATARTDVTRSFDLAVTKSANRASLPAAAPNDPRAVDYTITVTNNGPSVASGVQVTDLIPTALELQSATPAGGGSCTAPVATSDPEHDQLTCTLTGTIPVGGTRTIAVDMLATSDLYAANQPVTETAHVSAPDEDPAQLGNNSATWTLSSAPYSDLELRKTAPATVTAGTMATYQLAITNHPFPPDNLTALAPILHDTLPAGVTLAPSTTAGSQTPSYCTADAGDPQQVTCDMPRPAENIGPGDTSTVTISVLIAPDVAAGTSLVNTARVESRPDNPDPVLANNTSSATSTVVADADVAVSGMTITPRDATVTGPGSAWNVDFTLANNGPSTARDVQFRTSIDPSVTVDPSTLPSSCTLDNGELVCTIDGHDLAPGQSVHLHFVMVVDGSVAPGAYAGTTHVSSTTTDSNPANNDDDATFTIGAAHTRLQVTKTAVDTIANPNGDGHQAYVAGKTYAFQITVAVPSSAGNGLADAQDVRLTDLMPAGFTATLASTTQGTCTTSPARLTCRLGTVAAYPNGATPVTVTVYGIVDDGASGEQLTNTATATSATPDASGNPATGSASASVDVVQQADLQLFKTADAPTFHPGGSVGYTLTTVNAGPSDVGDATATDTLPVGLDLDPASSPGCTVSSGTPATGETVVCAIGRIDVGTSVATRVVATTSPDDTPRSLVNTATVTASATDPHLANNTSSVTVALDRLADVAIAGTVSTTTPAAGGDITYTAYTINNGPSVAEHLTADTTFPPGFVPVSVDVPLNTCTWSPAAPPDPASVAWRNVSYTLHCEPTDPSLLFEPGVSVTSVVVMHVPGDTPAGAYAGSSTIQTPTPESDYTNNTAAISVNVQRVADTTLTKTLVRPNPMVAGQPATWRLTATNKGPSIADNVVISDTVPANMTLVSATNESGAACPAPEIKDTEVIVKCQMGTLQVGESASALVTFAIAGDATGQTLCNSALVGSAALDDHADDNDATACSTASAPPPAPPAGSSADLAVRVVPTVRHPKPGGKAGFVTTVTNHGPDAAADSVVRIRLPAGLKHPTTSIPGCTVTGRIPVGRATTGHVLVCHLGTLARGDAVRITVAGTAGSGLPDGATLTAHAAVRHAGKDADPANDRDRGTATVRRADHTGTPGTTNGPGGPASPAATPPANPPAGPAPGGLPDTGSDVPRWWLPASGGLIGLGLLLLVAARTRSVKSRHR